VDQGERASIPHVPDTARDRRAPGPGSRAPSCSEAQRALRRHASKVRAVCGSATYMDLVRRVPGDRHPYRLAAPRWAGLGSGGYFSVLCPVG